MAASPKPVPANQEAATKYARQGWAVIPLHSLNQRGKCTCGHDPCPQKPGKHPRIKDWPNQASVSELEILGWLGKWPGMNLGIVTGAKSGLVVIDVDLRHDGAEAFNELQAKYGILPATLTVRTGSGGWHYYYRHPGGLVIPNQTGGMGKFADYEGVDVRGDGGYVVAPPSIHASGEKYRWDMTAPHTIADLPQAYIDFLKREDRPERQHVSAPSGDLAAAGQHWLEKAIAQASVGSRNQTGLWLACQLRDAGLEYLDAETVMEEYASAVTRADDPYTDREARASLRQAYRSAPREAARSRLRVIRPGDAPEGGASEDDQGAARRYHFTQEGNAQRLIDKHGDRLRYVTAWKTWLIWDGKRWKKDDRQEVVLFCKDVIRGILTEALEMEDEGREALIKHALKSEKAAEINGMLALAGPEVAIAPDELDANPWVLNVENGTIDLRTGKLRDHDRADLITKIMPVHYDPQATAPRWAVFIDWMTAQRKDLAAFVQKAVGYSLTGSTAEQVIFIMYGGGDNGKSTFLDVLRPMLGGYATHTPAQSLMRRDNDNGMNNDIARLFGTRFVTASEGNEGQRLAESIVKEMTGDQAITARHMYQDFFTFAPTFKIWLGTNFKPVLRDTGHSMRRRMRLIPFDAKIAEDKKDPDLKDKLAAEASGILNWAIAGCLAWQREGLKQPASVQEATDNYMAEMDVVGHWVGDCCILHPAAKATSRQLFKSYEVWAKDNGENALGSRTFSSRLSARGLKNKHTDKGTVFIGIGLREDFPPGGGLTMPDMDDEKVSGQPDQEAPTLAGYAPDTSDTSDVYSEKSSYEKISATFQDNYHEVSGLADAIGANVAAVYVPGADTLGVEVSEKVSGLTVSNVSPPKVASMKPSGICPNCGRCDRYTWSEMAGDFSCNSCRQLYQVSLRLAAEDD